jgi:hypothetical protein
VTALARAPLGKDITVRRRLAGDSVGRSGVAGAGEARGAGHARTALLITAIFGWRRLGRGLLSVRERVDAQDGRASP